MRYRVSGNREVMGHKPGEEFEAELDGVTESRLFSGGHIERVSEYVFDPGRGKHDRNEENDDVSPDEA